MDLRWDGWVGHYLLMDFILNRPGNGLDDCRGKSYDRHSFACVSLQPVEI
jgi:hypothetical protein